MKTTMMILIALLASTLAHPTPNENHENNVRAKRSLLGSYLYPHYGYGFAYPGYGLAYPTYGYPYYVGGYGLYKGFGYGNGFYG